MNSPNQDDFVRAVDMASEVIKRFIGPGASMVFVHWLNEDDSGHEEHNKRLVDEALTDSLIFDALNRAIANGLRDRESIPEVMIAFATDVLEGQITRPKAKRQPNYKFNKAVICAISELARHSPLYLTRNDESLHKMSVLDAVVSAVSKTTGKRIAYSTLKRDFYKSARKQIENDRLSGFSFFDVGGN